MESFLVSQLKKQNRQLKLDMHQKDNEIENLKRNIKLAKNKEYESEMQVYIEECQRLRTLLEQTAIQNDTLQERLAGQEEISQNDLVQIT